MLSNTATPYYYGKFRESVIKGDIIVGEQVSLQMQLIDDLIEDPRYYYDDQAINGYVEFCNNELVLTDGSNMELLDTFKLWAEDVLAWFYFPEETIFNPRTRRYETISVKRRLRNKQYLIVARGAAKSMYSSSIQGYGLVADKTTTQGIVTAPTVDQTDAIMAPLRTAIARSRGPVFKLMTSDILPIGNYNNHRKKTLLASTKKGIENFATNSIIETRPMSIDKMQGLACKYTTIDEWLSCDIREDVIGAVEQGASKVDDYLIIATSSEGTVRNSVGDTIKMELNSILRREYPNPHVSIWHYKLDDIREVNDPRFWVKANPNIGITMSFAAYEKDKIRAEKVPSEKNDILAKRFGIPCEGYTYFFTYEETLPKSKREFYGLPCAMGADLSQGDDFCAFTFIFPNRKGGFGVKTRSYITSRTLNNLPTATYMKYEEFMREGSLVVMEGSVLNMMDVYDDIDKHIEKSKYDVIAFGYDPYNAREFVERWSREHTDYGVVKVPQGVKTESVPLGELKILAEDRMLDFDEELMCFAMGNCIVLQDTNGNRKLYKKRREDKIDNVAAMMDAYVAYKAYMEDFE